MSKLVSAPNLDLDIDDLLPDNGLNLNSVLSGLLSQTGSLNGLGFGEVVSTFDSIVSQVGGRTIRYVGEFVSTVEQSIAGSNSSLTGSLDQIIIEQAGDVVAVLDLDDALGLDFGSVFSLQLLGLNIGEILDGVLGGLLEDLLGGVGGILDVVEEPVEDVLDTVQTLLDDLAGSENPGGLPTNGDDILIGSKKADTIRALGGDDVVYGGGGNDKLFGGAGNDELYGGSGNDKLRGDAGVDVLIGGAGKDKLIGGAGDDTLIGNGGRDVLKGGDGADEFVFMSAKDSRVKTGVDVIKDFSRADGDVIDVTAFGDFDFIGRQRFSGDGDELRMVQKNGDTFVQGDVNGDGKVDFTIRLDDKINLNDGDFIL